LILDLDFATLWDTLWGVTNCKREDREESEESAKFFVY